MTSNCPVARSGYYCLLTFAAVYRPVMIIGHCLFHDLQHMVPPSTTQKPEPHSLSSLARRSLASRMFSVRSGMGLLQPGMGYHAIAIA